MPVETTHHLYDSRMPQWQRCRDAFNGTDAVKERGADYLPMLVGQNNQEYAAYKQRAMWYGATGRTVEGLVGAVTRKDAKIDMPDAMEQQTKDITMSGIPLMVFIKELLNEVLTTGRAGVLVDMGRDMTLDAMVARPYWVMYTAEQIINWRVETFYGRQRLMQVILCEEYEVRDPNDPFVVECKKRYRELAIEDERYVVRIHTPRSVDGKLTYDVEEVVPVYRGDALKEIPFCFFGVTGLNAVPEKPPIVDLVDVNYSHYRSSADLEHGRHYTALPTPWVAGFPIDTVAKIGSSIAWVSADANARVGMLEFTGQGLGALEKALEAKEKLMAVLGARMIEEARPGVEAFETTALRSMGERSVLQSAANIVSLGVTQLLRWHAMWMGIRALETINAELNSDFISTQLKGSELTELVKAWQAGAISYETLYWNLQRGEITRPDISAEDEQTLLETQEADRIEKEAKALMLTGATPGTGTPVVE